MTTNIDNALRTIFQTPQLPDKYNGRKQRFRDGQMGLASKIRLLQEFGYKIEIRVTPPEG